MGNKYLRKFTFSVSIFLLLLTFLPTVKLHASHALGADLTYECLGPNRYRVTFKFLRDCNGISAPSSVAISYSSAACGVNSSVSLSQVGSAVDITPVCPSQGTSCSGGGSIGFELYTYQGVMNLPAGCGTDWVLGWSTCCRNYSAWSNNN